MNDLTVRFLQRHDLFGMHAPQCESPIEWMLFNAIALRLGASLYDCAAVCHGARPELRLETQVPEGAYRIDLALRSNDYDARIAIECDGHDFHEKTKQQASRDKGRDRALQLAGWQVLRFTGSDIYRDPFGCAEQAIACASAAEGRLVAVEVEADRARTP